MHRARYIKAPRSYFSALQLGLFSSTTGGYSRYSSVNAFLLVRSLAIYKDDRFHWPLNFHILAGENAAHSYSCFSNIHFKVNRFYSRINNEKANEGDSLFDDPENCYDDGIDIPTSINDSSKSKNENLGYNTSGYTIGNEASSKNYSNFKNHDNENNDDDYDFLNPSPSWSPESRDFFDSTDMCDNMDFDNDAETLSLSNVSSSESNSNVSHRRTFSQSRSPDSSSIPLSNNSSASTTNFNPGSQASSYPYSSMNYSSSFSQFNNFNESQSVHLQHNNVHQRPINSVSAVPPMTDVYPSNTIPSPNQYSPNQATLNSSNSNFQQPYHHMNATPPSSLSPHFNQFNPNSAGQFSPSPGNTPSSNFVTNSPQSFPNYSPVPPSSIQFVHNNHPHYRQSSPQAVVGPNNTSYDQYSTSNLVNNNAIRGSTTNGFTAHQSSNIGQFQSFPQSEATHNKYSLPYGGVTDGSDPQISGNNQYATGFMSQDQFQYQQQPFGNPYVETEDPYTRNRYGGNNLYNKSYVESGGGPGGSPRYPPPGFVGDVYNKRIIGNNSSNWGSSSADGTGGSSGASGSRANNFFQGPGNKFNSLGSGLQAIDWSTEIVPEVKKDFYIEHKNVSVRSEEEVQEILAKADISIQGTPPIPKAIVLFEEACFPDYIQSEIQAMKFQSPTPIQSVAWPIALKGRDMIGISQTGSGKTLAFLLPAMLHVNAQPPLRPGDGPIVLVLAPTRELAVQIQKEASRFGLSSKIKNTCVYGGVSRYSQANDLRNGREIVIATPGRLLDFLESGVTNLKRVTYLVLDEADRMLDMGFEPQIRKVCNQIRPDRQTLFFSATWPREVQALAKEFCTENPVKIQVGKCELQANPNIRQEVIVVPQVDLKTKFFEWLKANAGGGGSGYSEKILIFCETKRGCDQLCRELRYQQYSALAIHGDKEQRERDRILADFKTNRCNILIATDVASRGLDIKNISFVVNYDLPKTIEDYVHRIGRTARGGSSGAAVTFFAFDYYTAEKARMARDISQVMRSVNQTPPDDIAELARSAAGSAATRHHRPHAQHHHHGAAAAAQADAWGGGGGGGAGGRRQQY